MIIRMTGSAGSLTVSNPTGRSVQVRLDPVNGLTDSVLGADFALAGKKLHARRVAQVERAQRDGKGKGALGQQ